jgi:hypothetical protein
MMTTFSAIRDSVAAGAARVRPPGRAWRLAARCQRLAIIGVLALALGALLGGCSALRVAYNTGPQLAWWWLDGYLDFSREHAREVRSGIDKWFEWHRATQLTEYAALLARVQREALAPVTPARLCELSTLVGDAVAPAVAQALAQAADLLPGLAEDQLRHLEERYRKNIDEMRRDYLQEDAAERREKSVKRTIERAEQLYGRLNDGQRKVIAEGVAASPFDPEGWMRERLRRQAETLATLRKLVADKPPREERLAALRRLADRSQRSPNPDYRAYQQRLTEYNCAFAARIHNAGDTEQRTRARDRLKGWEEDLRGLAAQQAGNGN